MTLYDSSVLRYCHYVTWQSHLVTARKRSCEKVMFLHESVNLFTGRVTPPPAPYPPPWNHAPSRDHTSPLPRTQKAGGTHPTRMLACWLNSCCNDNFLTDSSEVRTFWFYRWMGGWVPMYFTVSGLLCRIKNSTLRQLLVKEPQPLLRVPCTKECVVLLYFNIEMNNHAQEKKNTRCGIVMSALPPATRLFSHESSCIT